MCSEIHFSSVHIDTDDLELNSVEGFPTAQTNFDVLQEFSSAYIPRWGMVKQRVKKRCPNSIMYSSIIGNHGIGVVLLAYPNLSTRRVNMDS